MLPKFCFGSFMLIVQSSLFRPIRASGDMSSGASGGAVSSGTVSSAASRGGSGVVAPRSATPRPAAMLGRRRLGRLRAARCREVAGIGPAWAVGRLNRVIKLPQQFCVEVPILNEQGRIDRDSDGNVKTLREVGMYTCYHEAQKNYWKRFFLQKIRKKFWKCKRIPGCLGATRSGEESLSNFP